jgi:hypothetical protein
MKVWTPIRYRDFYDVPRIFLVQTGDALYLFDCRFDAAKDDYEETYEIFLMPGLQDQDLIESWEGLSARAKKSLGKVNVSEVEFDPSRRKQINLEIL